MRLTRTQFETIAAMHVLQPVTVKALKLYLGIANHNQSGHKPLEELVDSGLVNRRKWAPPKMPKLNKVQRLKMELAGQKIPSKHRGRRAYIYTLAPHAEIAAEHIYHALASLQCARLNGHQVTAPTTRHNGAADHHSGAAS